MCFRSKRSIKFKIPDFNLNNVSIPRVNDFKYLGNFLCDSNSDALDIKRQRKKYIYAREFFDELVFHVYY